MAPPGYIRVFACTDDSTLSQIALEYTRAILTIAPVRVMSVTPGGLEGRWSAFTGLLATPMTQLLCNVVICDPARWTWLQSVPMPAADVRLDELAAATVADGGTEGADPFAAVDATESTDLAQGRLELYTANVRNVLIAVASPRDGHQLATARKYDAIVVPSEAHSIWWSRRGTMERLTLINATPGVPVDRHAVRSIICPKEAQ